MFRRNQFVDRQRGMMQKNNTQEQHKKASSSPIS